MRPLLLIPLAVAVATVASASSLLVSARSLGAATVATLPCTSAALSVVPVLDVTETYITSVSVGVLPTTCGGSTLQVGVTAAGISGTGSRAVPAGGGTLVVTLSRRVPLSTITSSSAVIVGP